VLGDAVAEADPEAVTAPAEEAAGGGEADPEADPEAVRVFGDAVAEADPEAVASDAVEMCIVRCT